MRIWLSLDFGEEELFDYLSTLTLQTFVANNLDKVFLVLYVHPSVDLTYLQTVEPEWLALFGEGAVYAKHPSGGGPVSGSSGTYFHQFGEGSTFSMPTLPDRRIYYLYEYPSYTDLQNLLDLYDVANGQHNGSLIYHVFDQADNCPNEERTGRVFLSNNGLSPITQATFGLSWQGVEQATFEWSGNLDTYRWVEINNWDSASWQFDGQDGDMVLYIKSINGVLDQETANDTVRSPIRGSRATTQQTGEIQWKTHNAPGYVYWEVLADEEVVTFGGNPQVKDVSLPYSNPYANSTVYTFPVDLTPHGQKCIRLRCKTIGSSCGDYLRYVQGNDTIPISVWLSAPTADDFYETKLYTNFVDTDDEAGRVPLSIVPNPTDGLVAIQTQLVHGSYVHMAVVNAVGQAVAAHEVPNASGSYTWRLDTHNLPNGLYHVVVQTERGRGQALLQVWR
jgi:hypothetical protein